MLPRNALSRAVGSKAWRTTKRFSTICRAANTASLALPPRTSQTPSKLPRPPALSNPSRPVPHDTDIKTIFDQPLSESSASFSKSLHPAGLFGDQLLQSPQYFITLAHATIRKAKAIVARITNAPNAGHAEMRLVVQNFDRLSDVLCGVIDTAELVRHGHPDPQWVDSANEAYEILCSYMNVLNTHPALYKVLAAVMADSSIASTFSPEEHAVALIFKRDFERSGIDLPPAQREEFVSLSSDIISLGRDFLVEGSGAKGHVDISVGRLRESLQESIKYNRKVKGVLDNLTKGMSRFTGKVRVQGGTWDAHMLLRYCADEGIRKDIYVASHRENASNVRTLEDLLRARHKLAKLVGKSNYAELTLSDKMAKNPDHVSYFLRALTEYNQPLALSEAQQLLESSIASSSKGHSSTLSPKLQAWNKEYFSELSTRHSTSSTSSSSFGFPPRLSLGTVFQGLSNFFSSAFGLRLRVAETTPGEIWSPDVRKLEVISEDSTSLHAEGQVIGWIFADLFEREGKHTGAAHYTVRCSRRLDRDDWAGDRPYIGSEEGDAGFEPADRAMTTMTPRTVRGKEGIYQLPISALLCDFPRPTMSQGPTMLAWHEVETLFHEMGHALHSMVGQTEYHNVAGTRCATDFVELPSILMEHFLASPEVQSLLIGRPISTPIESSRTNSRGSTPALDAHSQILLALVDQAYHSSAAGEPSFSSTVTWGKLHDTLGVIPYAHGTAWQTQFSHLYGYGATYYSYLFDQAIASRVFKTIFKNHPLGRENGERYMKEVLRWGGGKDPWEMIGRLLEDEEIVTGDRKAMEKVGKWGIAAHATSISQ